MKVRIKEIVEEKLQKGTMERIQRKFIKFVSGESGNRRLITLSYC